MHAVRSITNKARDGYVVIVRMLVRRALLGLLALAAGMLGGGPFLKRCPCRHGAGVGSTLPRGYGFEWTGAALQEKEAAG